MRMQHMHPHFYYRNIQLDYVGPHGSLANLREVAL
jgi:hypothetical protein